MLGSFVGGSYATSVPLLSLSTNYVLFYERLGIAAVAVMHRLRHVALGKCAI